MGGYEESCLGQKHTRSFGKGVGARRQVSIDAPNPRRGANESRVSLALRNDATNEPAPTGPKPTAPMTAMIRKKKKPQGRADPLVEQERRGEAEDKNTAQGQKPERFSERHGAPAVSPTAIVGCHRHQRHRPTSIV